ncbi:DUF4085 family protein [Bacillaceae bacterium Marseille-Q3522]|nr:DUF4085 family protein [Bacillaceae bacterium Marseille-Q3522]
MEYFEREEGEDIYARLKDELEIVKDELLCVLLSRFIPYVENGTLNQPTLLKTVREDYLQWIREADREFTDILDCAYEQTKKSVSNLPTTVQEIFEESLHDSTIQQIIRDGDTLHLYVNTDGGFSSKSLIHFIFNHVLSEKADQPILEGQWLIYYELRKIEDGFAFRILFDSLDSEWTITMKDMDAEYFYRPSLYQSLRDEEKLEKTSLGEYIAQLNPDHSYWLITPHVTSTVTSFTENLQLENGRLVYNGNEVVVTVENKRFTYRLEEYNPIAFIYTDVYENFDEQCNEPVPTENLEAAALSDELELQVRAWNTMYTDPEKLADIINRVLMKIEITEENEMMIIVYRRLRGSNTPTSKLEVKPIKLGGG